MYVKVIFSLKFCILDLKNDYILNFHVKMKLIWENKTQKLFYVIKVCELEAIVKYYMRKIKQIEGNTIDQTCKIGKNRAFD